MVLAIALLAAFAARKWPPDGPLARPPGTTPAPQTDNSSIADRAVAEARGFFPKGCKWREVNKV